MRKIRLAKIIDIITEHSVETQDELLEHLRREGFDVTQATISRDIRELRLVKGNAGSDFLHDGYRVVYTKENETADAFIEKMMHELGPDYSIRAVTGDSLIPLSALHAGVLRMTARELFEEIEAVNEEIAEFLSRLADQK